MNEMAKDSNLNDDQTETNQIKKKVAKDSDMNDDETETNQIKKAESEDAEESEDTEESEYSEDCELGMDPLMLTKDIVLKYHEFVDYIFQMLKLDEQKEKKKEEEEELELYWQRWDEIVKRGKQMVGALKKRLKKVGLEMEWLQTEDFFEQQYTLRKTHLPYILAQLRDINSRLASSPHIRVVSDIKKRDSVLAMCLNELQDAKQELSELMEIIKVLNVLDTIEDDDDDGIDQETE